MSMRPLAWGVDSPSLYIIFTLDMWPKTRGVRSMIEVKVNTARLSFFGGLWCCGSVVASTLQFTTTTYHASPTIMQRINLLQDDPPPFISQSHNTTLASSEPMGVTNAAMNCRASLHSSQQILGWWAGGLVLNGFWYISAIFYFFCLSLLTKYHKYLSRFT